MVLSAWVHEPTVERLVSNGIIFRSRLIDKTATSLSLSGTSNTDGHEQGSPAVFLKVGVSAAYSQPYL